MLKKLTIRSRLIILVALTSIVSLAVGVVGLIQSSNGERSFESIYDNRVISAGYLKDIEIAYTVQIIGAANKFADGVVTAQDALASIKSAQSQIATTWPRFVALQHDDVDKELASSADALMKGVDSTVTMLNSLLERGDRAAIRKFIASDWYAAADPLADQLTTLYQTAQSEGRNDFQDLTVTYARGRKIQFSIIIFGLVASLFIGWTVLVTVTRSLRNVRNQLHELAAGEGDLTKRLIIGEDEVGQIASEVNDLME
ncbi:MAG: Tar ligand binding domain-containing protein, partial [Candidatus Acidiferrales bacterium]